MTSISRIVLFSLACTLAAAVAHAADAPDTFQVPRVDMRTSDSAAVRERAAADSKRRIVLVLYGDDAAALQSVQDAAFDALARNLPVDSILWANEAAGRGVAVYGIEGAPFGPLIPLDGDLRRATTERISELAERLLLPPGAVKERTASTSGEVHPDDVVRCRTVKETGSRLRGTRVCTSRRQDREMAEAARRDAENQQNQTYIAPEPSMGGG